MNRANIKYKKRRLQGHALGKGIAITTMAAVSLAVLHGCDISESCGSQIIVDPTSSFVVIDGQTVTPAPAITVGKEKQTVSPTPTGTVNSKPSTQTGSTTDGNTTNNGNGSGINATPTTKPTNSTTTTSAASPTPKPSGQGSGSATATPNPTNNTTNNTTVEPTSTPSSSSEQTSSGGESSSGSESSGGGTSHTADPYSESCDCPYCSGDVSYRSASTVHHDAVTHDETTSSYDGIVRTYKYTINWSGNFKDWCAENGVDLPSAPSATGSVVFDSDWNTLDSSGEDNALDQIFEDADDIADNLGFTGNPYSYICDVIDDEYLNYTETTTTIIDEPAWDENIPAGWYCDDCDYYSASVPRAYDDIDI